MKIKSVYIENIQSIKRLKIDIDEGITRIQGRNTSGKSCIKKSIEIFSGNYTRQEIKGLVRNQKLPGEVSRVSILLEDDTILTAIINNNYNVDYIHTDMNNNIISKWNKYSDEILEILDWKNVEDEKVCLNIKESDIHLFINTKPVTNGVLVDYLCRDKDIELKIASLEQKEDDLKELSKDVVYYLNDISEEFRLYPEIDEIKFDIVTKKFSICKYNLEILNKVNKLYELRNINLKFQYKKYILNKIRLINSLNTLIRYNKLKNTLESINKINNKCITLGHIDKISNINDKKYIISANNKILSKIFKLNKVYKCKYYKNIDSAYKNNKNKINITKNLSNNIEKSVKTLEKINDLNNNIEINKKYNLLNERILANREFYRRLYQYSTLSQYKTILTGKNKCLNNINADKKIINRLEILKSYERINESLNNYRNFKNNVQYLKEYIRKNNKCPTCGNNIDVEKYNLM